MQAGERLPSVRAVASELGINPMTVSKAYSLLEKDGVVARHRGLGMVVAENALDASDALRLQADALVEAAHRLGLARRAVDEAVARAWRVAEENP